MFAVINLFWASFLAYLICNFVRGGSQFPPLLHFYCLSSCIMSYIGSVSSLNSVQQFVDVCSTTRLSTWLTTLRGCHSTTFAVGQSSTVGRTASPGELSYMPLMIPNQSAEENIMEPRSSRFVLLAWSYLTPCQSNSKSTQPCIAPGSLNQVPASAGEAGKLPLPGSG